MIAIRLLKLELKYSIKLKLYKNYIDSWLNELKLELNNAKKTEMCLCGMHLFCLWAALLWTTKLYVQVSRDESLSKTQSDEVLKETSSPS